MRLTKCISGVRPFVAHDIPAVAALHQRVFGGDSGAAEYDTYFRRVYLENPSRHESIEPLVFEEGGEIVGFLGSVPRRMIWNGAPVIAAVITNFAVSPESRGMVGVKLLGSFLAGGQDISISDMVGPSARRTWEGLGGATSLLHSVRWVSLLCPTQASLQVLGRRRGLSIAARLLSPGARALDALARRVPKSPFQWEESPLVASPLEPSDILENTERLLKPFPLHVDYDVASLLWMLQRAEEMNSTGDLQKVLLKTKEGRIVGWYLYYSKPGGIADLLQIIAEEQHFDDAFNHLCSHARARGGVGVMGRLERGLLTPLARRFCVFDRQQWWVLVHSRCQELMNAFQRGDAFFSRLEGEWCLRFKG